MPYNYLVWTFAAQKGNESVAKIGATNKTIQERMKAYKNGILLACCYVNDPFLIEKKIKRKFKKKCIQRLDYGSKYFEGDLNILIKRFDRIVKKYKIAPSINNCVNNYLELFEKNVEITNNSTDFILSFDLYSLCSQSGKYNRKNIKTSFSEYSNIKYQERNVGPKRQAGWIGAKIIKM